jgi:hypothetical protein
VGALELKELFPVHCAGRALFLCNSTRTAFSFFFLLVGIEDYSDQKSDICSVSGCQKIRVEFAVAVLVVIIALQFYH